MVTFVGGFLWLATAFPVLFCFKTLITIWRDTYIWKCICSLPACLDCNVSSVRSGIPTVCSGYCWTLSTWNSAWQTVGTKHLFEGVNGYIVRTWRTDSLGNRNPTNKVITKLGSCVGCATKWPWEGCWVPLGSVTSCAEWGGSPCQLYEFTNPQSTKIWLWDLIIFSVQSIC